MNTDRNSCLPTFLVIGAMKGGSTSVARYLQSHPEIFVAMEPWLEPEYFSWNWERGLDWYEELFAAGVEKRVRGERSNYARAPQMPGIPARIASVVPNARLVYLVRNPVDRIRSMYSEWADKGWERRPIAQAIVEDPRYVDWSRYAYQIEQYLEHFDRGQILVVRSEDLLSRRAESLTKILEFIGATPDPSLVHAEAEWNLGRDKRHTNRLFDTARGALARSRVLRHIPKNVKRRVRRTVNRRRIDNTLPPALEQDLWGQLKPDLARLTEMLGADFDTWDRP